LTTSSFLLVAATTFALQSHGGTRTCLLIADGFAFVSVLASVLSLGIEEHPGVPLRWSLTLWPLPQIHKKVQTWFAKRSKYERKYRYTKAGLICLLISVEGGTLFTAAVKLHWIFS
jgi:hypothetical protein